MTAKQYLASYKRLEGRYKTALEDYRNIENEMVSIKSPSFDERVQTSAKSDPIGEIVIRLETEKGKLGIDIFELRGKMTLIRNQIESMKKVSEEYYMVLLLRYVLYKDWKFICDSMVVSRTQANVIHGYALAEFDKIFSKEYSLKQN